MKSPRRSKSTSVFEDEDLSALLGEFDAVIQDLSSPEDEGRFKYEEHLRELKRQRSISISDSGISDTESAESLNRRSFSYSDEKLSSPVCVCSIAPSSKAKLGDTKELEDFIADLDKTIAGM